MPATIGVSSQQGTGVVLRGEGTRLIIDALHSPDLVRMTMHTTTTSPMRNVSLLSRPSRMQRLSSGAYRTFSMPC